MPGTAAAPPLEIDPTALAAMRDSGQALQLLDVREGWEFEICSIAGSLNIPMGQVPGRAGELARDRPLVVLCHHGGRSMQVTRWLRSQGFDQATNLAGGIDVWARQIEPGMATY